MVGRQYNQTILNRQQSVRTCRNQRRTDRSTTKPKTKHMKTIKMLTLAAFVAAVSCTGAFANEGDKSCADKKEHKCCAEAKAAGKTCEKCAPKGEKK